VLEARRRVGERIEQMTGRTPAAAGASASGSVRHASIQDSIYSGSVRPPTAPKSGGSPVGGFIVLLLIVGGIVYGCSRSGSNESDASGADSSSSITSQEADAGLGQVSREEFEAVGRTWPLTVDRGTLACEPASQVTFTSGGTTYAANGTALSAGEWPEIDPIWADDGSGLGLKVGIGDLIEAGLALC
jgi:hypothetical protein